MINYNILDSNTFIGQSGKREVMYFETKEDLLSDMKYYNISEALVTHFMSKEYYPSHGNSLLLNEIKNIKNLHPCWVLPCYQRPDEEKISKTIEDMLSLGIKIVRVYPPSRTPDLIEFWENKLGITWTDNMEVWDGWNESKEILNIMEIKKQKYEISN